MAHFCQRTYQPTGETFQAFVPTTIGVDFKFDVAQIKAFTALDQLISDSHLPQINFGTVGMPEERGR
ncbi:MAG: hypothetical protein ACI9J4_000344 [Paraglaciecola sp.]|jgi:hypothetical protein